MSQKGLIDLNCLYFMVNHQSDSLADCLDRFLLAENIFRQIVLIQTRTNICHCFLIYLFLTRITGLDYKSCTSISPNLSYFSIVKQYLPLFPSVLLEKRLTMQWYYNYHHCFNRQSFSVVANQIIFGTGLFNYCTCGHCG